jgi:hypothetical protein
MALRTKCNARGKGEGNASEAQEVEVRFERISGSFPYAALSKFHHYCLINDL